MQEVIEVECTACSGTGIYVGMREGHGLGVVCAKCHGTGAQTLTFRRFTGRRRRCDIKRVIAYNPGVVLTADVAGGMPYEDWVNNKPFPPRSEVREVCPLLWYQKVDYDNRPSWQGCRVELGGNIKDCPSYAHKEACWALWDMEHPVDGSR